MTIANTKTNLIGMTLNQLEELMQELGLEKFRAKQIYKWIYTKSVRDFDLMTDLSKTTKDILKHKCQIGSLKLKEKQESQDGTKKFLFELEDGNVVESVLMRFERNLEQTSLSDLDSGEAFVGEEAEFIWDIDEPSGQTNNQASNLMDTACKYNRRVDLIRHTACISSQVGCAVGCSFCATGTLGFKKNLTASEIVEQILFVQAETNERIDNIVYMGQGEPLHNYDEVVLSIKKMREDVGIGARHITVSTSGIVPKINQLADEGVQLTLALSLHDPEDKDRDYLVPINKKWKVQDQIDALTNYVTKTNRRVTIEYVLLNGVNDSPEKAKILGELIKNLHCNINLIPYNPTDVKDPYQRSTKKSIDQFKTILEKASRGKKVTVRKEKGTDIDAACGQLANKHTGQAQI